MASEINTDELQVIFKDVKIPSQPEALLEVQKILQGGSPDLNSIASAIAKDVGLAALVVRTINSPYFGLRAKVQSIHHATMMLGIKNIKQVVAGLALRRAFEESGENPPNFWDSPVNVGLVAASAARRYSGIPADEAYMLGLFHNCGEALMLRRFSGYRETLREALCSGTPMTEAEDQKYQTNHAVVGYFVAKSWGLPKHICQIVLNHHEADTWFTDNAGTTSAEGELLAILKLAEHIDNRFWRWCPEDHEWERLKPLALGYLGLGESDFEDIRDDMLEQLNEAGQG